MDHYPKSENSQDLWNLATRLDTILFTSFKRQNRYKLGVTTTLRENSVKDKK